MDDSYSRVARRYAEEIGTELPGKPVDRALYGLFADLVGPGAVVGDVGCGPGHITRHLADLGLRPAGVDASPGMIEVARERYPELPFTVGTFAELPVADGAWAGAVAPYSIIHLDADGRRTAFASLRRVIVAGGWLLVAFHISEDGYASGESMHVEQWWGESVDVTFHFLDPAVVAAELAGAGFTILARTDREPWPGVEAPSRRSYLLARRS
jgi:ubiquinone/menaquinone biosynthesis C-methylase UbiE